MATRTLGRAVHSKRFVPLSRGAALTLGLLLLMACGGEAEDVTTPTTGAAVSSPAVSASPTRATSPTASPAASPVATPRATPVASPVASPTRASASPVATPVASRVIQGLTVELVTMPLETIGMDCSGPTSQGTISQWVCTGGVIDQRVVINGISATQVTALETTIEDARANQALVTEFLGILIGLIPFSGDAATDAEQWMNDNVAMGGSRTFDGISIRLTWQGDDLVTTIAGA